MNADASPARLTAGDTWYEDFTTSKRSAGYKYEDKMAAPLKQLARSLAGLGIMSPAASKAMAEEFYAQRDSWSETTRAKQFSLARQFMLFLRLRGHDCWVPPIDRRPIRRSDFAPYVINADEMARIITQADQRPTCARMKASKPVYSMLARLLWCCGLRISEATGLKLGDVDLAGSYLTIRHAKNNRTRLVPMSASLSRHVNAYTEQMNLDWDQPDGYFFPSVRGGGYHPIAMSRQMKTIMAEAGVSREDGSPPRVHDIRHGYAVAALAKMERDGMDVYAGLPLLATFMGHRDIKSTEYYLRLTRPEFTSIQETMAATYEGLFPAHDEAL